MNKQEIVKQINELLTKLVEEPKPSRFKDQGDGTILDSQTNLVWEKNFRELTWQDAMDYTKNLKLGGKNDWRLPTRQELESLLNLERYNPASDFPDMPSDYFWSSSSYASSPNLAWDVYFYNGYVYNRGKMYTNYARCVRGGP